MGRTCCSVQSGEACERNASSSISCRPRAKHNSPVMITHRLLQITLRNPKNQRLQAGANRRERESGASGEDLMNLVPSQYGFRKFSLFQLPHLPPLANCHVFSCSADDLLFRKAPEKVEQTLCCELNITHGRCRGHSSSEGAENKAMGKDVP